MSQKTLQTLNEEELDFVERVLEQQKAMVQIPVLTQGWRNNPTKASTGSE